MMCNGRGERKETVGRDWEGLVVRVAKDSKLGTN